MISDVLSLTHIYYVYCLYIIKNEDFGYARLKYYKPVTVYLQLFIRFISDGLVNILKI